MIHMNCKYSIGMGFSPSYNLKKHPLVLYQKLNQHDLD